MAEGAKQEEDARREGDKVAKALAERPELRLDMINGSEFEDKIYFSDEGRNFGHKVIINPDAQPTYSNREDAIKNMDIDTTMYIRRGDSGYITRESLEYSKYAGNSYKTLKDSNLDELKGKALELLHDPKILGLEARYDAAQKAADGFEEEMKVKYPDAPDLTSKDMVYKGGDGPLNEAEKQDLDTRMFLNINFLDTKLVRVEKSESEKSGALYKERLESEDKFLAALDAKVEELLPNGTVTEKIFVKNSFHRSDDFVKSPENAKGAEIPSGTNVPAPKAIDPEILKQGGKAPE
jgi:hypothetical protein